jgi:hypothetical protein
MNTNFLARQNKGYLVSYVASNGQKMYLSKEFPIFTSNREEASHHYPTQLKTVRRELEGAGIKEKLSVEPEYYV